MQPGRNHAGSRPGATLPPVEERYEAELTRSAAVLDGVDRALRAPERRHLRVVRDLRRPGPRRRPRSRSRPAACASSTCRSGSTPAARAGPGPGQPATFSPLGRVEAGRHVGPVDDVPQGGEEVGLHVLVLQVEGVLPGVEDEERDRALADVALVVVDLLDDEPAGKGLVGQDAPARALDGGGGLGEVRLELVEGAEVLVDGRARARRRACRRRRGSGSSRRWSAGRGPRCGRPASSRAPRWRRSRPCRGRRPASRASGWPRSRRRRGACRDGAP